MKAEQERKAQEEQRIREEAQRNIEEERKRAMDGWLSLHIRPSNIGSSEPSPIDSIIAHFRGVSAIIVTLKGIHEVRPVELRSSKEFKELDDRAWKTAEVLSKTAVEMPKSYKRKNKIFFWARILSNELEVVITFHGSPLSQSIPR